MKKELSKSDARKKISEFFEKKNFSPEEVRKIKRAAMKFNIKLGKNRAAFCKKCLSKLCGTTRISKDCRRVKCASCGFENRVRIR